MEEGDSPETRYVGSLLIVYLCVSLLCLVIRNGLMANWPPLQYCWEKIERTGGFRGDNVGKPGPGPKAYPGSPIGPGLEARQMRAIR
jgi:hypothetical protein